MNIKQFLTKSLPKTLRKPPATLHYGTSGFRDSPDNLPMSRVALCAYMRSSTLAGKFIGILLTASHNPAKDNGIKLIDHNGEMFDNAWEGIIDKIVNSDDGNLYSELNKVHRNFGNFRPFGDGPAANILVGRDTRASGKELTREITELMKHFNCRVSDYGVVSTPQMHYLAAQCNKQNSLVEKERYFDMFVKFVSYAGLTEQIHVDTSNGVSEYILTRLNERLANVVYKGVSGSGRGVGEVGVKGVSVSDNDKGDNDKGDNDKEKNSNTDTTDNTITSTNTNTSTNRVTGTSSNTNTNTNTDNGKPCHALLFIITNPGGEVNDRCGAQYVLYEKKVPPHLEGKKGNYVAFDGDMDRFVYFSWNGALSFIDGDRQASILVKYFHEKKKESESLGAMSLGCVLSDYSNSAAVNYVSAFCEVSKARAGIKNLMKKSKEYDVGVYNEPNGHGGVYMNVDVEDEEICAIKKVYEESLADPLANLLVLEYLKKARPSVFEDSYAPFSSRIMQVEVSDPLVVKNSAETMEVLEPLGLKNVINNILKNDKVKVFVRPSGTESVIRVFCEAKENVDGMCLTVAQAVYDLCGGVGKHPEISYV